MNLTNNLNTGPHQITYLLSQPFGTGSIIKKNVFIKMAGSKQVYAEDIWTELMSPLPKACVYLKNTIKLIFQLFKSS